MTVKLNLYFVDASLVVTKLHCFLEALLENNIPTIVATESREIWDKQIGQVMYLLKKYHYFTINSISGSVNCCELNDNVLFSFRKDVMSFLETDYRPLLKLMGVPDDFGVLPFYTDSRGNLWIDSPVILKLWQNIKV